VGGIGGGGLISADRLGQEGVCGGRWLVHPDYSHQSRGDGIVAQYK